MTNVNVAIEQLLPQAGSDMAGWKLGLIPTVAKGTQNDTVTVTNASEVIVLSAIHITTGAWETHTAATNVVTLTSVTTGAKKLYCKYKS